MRKRKTCELTIPSSIKSLEPVATRNSRPVYADNPFLEAFSIKAGPKSITFAAGLQAIDTNGDAVGAAAISTFTTVDREEFIKIYVRNINSIFCLSSAAQKVFSALMLAIQKEAIGVAHVYFSYQKAVDCCHELGMPVFSKPTYTRGMSDLVKANFIADNREGPCWYWLNPNVLFNGDRVAFIENYRIQRKEERLEEKRKQLEK